MAAAPETAHATRSRLMAEQLAPYLTPLVDELVAARLAELVAPAVADVTREVREMGERLEQRAAEAFAAMQQRIDDELSGRRPDPRRGLRVVDPEPESEEPKP